MWWYVALFYLALPVLVLASLRWGGPDERKVAKMFAAAAFLSVALRALQLGTLFSVSRYDAGVVVIDTALLAGLIVLAIRAQKWWIICEAALQMTTMSSYILKVLAVPLSWRAYALMNGSASYPALLLLTFAIWQYRRRARTASCTSVELLSEVDHLGPTSPRGV